MDRPPLNASGPWIAAWMLHACISSAQAACVLVDSKTLDQTACLREQVASAAGQSPPRVALPAGYSILVSAATELPAGMTLDGQGATIFSRLAGYDVLRIVGSNVTVANVALVNENRLASSETLSKVWIGRGVANVLVSNVTMKDAARNGRVRGVIIETPYVTDVTIQGSLFDGVQFPVLAKAWLGHSQFTSAELLDPNSYPTRIRVLNNRMRAIRGDGVNMNSPIDLAGLAAGVHGISDVTISGNRIEAPGNIDSAAGFCVSLAGTRRVYITGNLLQNCKWQGIHIEDSSEDVTIHGNWILDLVGPRPGDLDGWGFTASIWAQHSRRVYILGNWMAQGADYGVRMDWDGTYNNSGFTVSGNTFDSQTHNGLVVWGPPEASVSTYVGPVPGFTGNRFWAVGGARVNASASGLTIRGNDPNDVTNLSVNVAAERVLVGQTQTYSLRQTAPSRPVIGELYVTPPGGPEQFLESGVWGTTDEKGAFQLQSFPLTEAHVGTIRAVFNVDDRSETVVFECADPSTVVAIDIGKPRVRVGERQSYVITGAPPATQVYGVVRVASPNEHPDEGHVYQQGVWGFTDASGTLALESGVYNEGLVGRVTVDITAAGRSGSVSFVVGPAPV